MTEFVMLYTLDPETVRGKMTAVPAARLSKLHAVICESVALRYLCRGIYDIGHFYVSKIKGNAEMRLLEKLEGPLSEEELSEIFQAALIGGSRRLAFRAFGKLVDRDSLTEAHLSRPFLELALRLKHLDASIEDVKRSFEQKIELDNQLIVKCLNDFLEEGADRARVSKLFAETIQRRDRLCMEKDRTLLGMYVKQAKQVESPVEGEVASYRLTPSVRLLETTKGFALHLDNEHPEMRALADELMQMFSLELKRNVDPKMSGKLFVCL